MNEISAGRVQVSRAQEGGLGALSTAHGLVLVWEPWAAHCKSGQLSGGEAGHRAGTCMPLRKGTGQLWGMGKEEEVPGLWMWPGESCCVSHAHFPPEFSGLCPLLPGALRSANHLLQQGGVGSSSYGGYWPMAELLGSPQSPTPGRPFVARVRKKAWVAQPTPGAPASWICRCALEARGGVQPRGTEESQGGGAGRQEALTLERTPQKDQEMREDGQLERKDLEAGVRERAGRSCLRTGRDRGGVDAGTPGAKASDLPKAAAPEARWARGEKAASTRALKDGKGGPRRGQLGNEPQAGMRGRRPREGTVASLGTSATAPSSGADRRGAGSLGPTPHTPAPPPGTTPPPAGSPPKPVRRILLRGRPSDRPPRVRLSVFLLSPPKPRLPFIPEASALSSEPSGSASSCYANEGGGRARGAGGGAGPQGARGGRGRDAGRRAGGGAGPRGARGGGRPLTKPDPCIQRRPGHSGPPRTGRGRWGRGAGTPGKRRGREGRGPSRGALPARSAAHSLAPALGSRPGCAAHSRDPAPPTRRRRAWSSSAPGGWGGGFDPARTSPEAPPGPACGDLRSGEGAEEARPGLPPISPGRRGRSRRGGAAALWPPLSLRLRPPRSRLPPCADPRGPRVLRPREARRQGGRRGRRRGRDAQGSCGTGSGAEQVGGLRAAARSEAPWGRGGGSSPRRTPRPGSGEGTPSQPSTSGWQWCAVLLAVRKEGEALGPERVDVQQDPVDVATTCHASGGSRTRPHLSGPPGASAEEAALELQDRPGFPTALLSLKWQEQNSLHPSHLLAPRTRTLKGMKPRASHKLSKENDKTETGAVSTRHSVFLSPVKLE
ncbi:hypothetical protein P7K49_002202 [Saguinus oedipus]|uniref:Collagen alpha-1(I) chain-like n=1 Tax=Saguinus oedipus TaxID=9490 RepID=A0ABQ9WHL7_SAGOE|nr:hypothetical protein P7K49_002202 [Saguinus oedipus]